jgi:aryl sulfotransferase
MNPGTIVWLASFPKSGNTWFRIFLAGLAAGEHGSVDINNLHQHLEAPGGIASSRAEFEEATMLDSGLLPCDDIDALRPRVHEWTAARAREERWIKVHDAWTLTSLGEPMLGRDTARAAIYLVRDPRDVAVSLASHNNTSIQKAIELMNAPDGALNPGGRGHLTPQLRQKLAGWSGHVTSWLDQTSVPVLPVRYEDLVADPLAGFGAALAFAGREAGEAAIERAVRRADFAELQRQEKAHGFRERTSGSEPFFRVGRANAWREVLTEDQVRAIEDPHAAVMTRMGYSLSLRSLGPAPGGLLPPVENVAGIPGLLRVSA